MATEKKRSKPKLPELDIVRAFAILAVVMIHATADATVDPLLASEKSRMLYLAVNKLCNYAVPVFIFISGLVLFYRYLDDWNGRQSVQFYIKRVRQALVPYVLWSLFYYLYNQWIFEPDNLRFDLQEFGDLLPWADASYHLYFMIIIVQFYLLFPLLMSLSQRFVWFRKALFLIGLLIQAGFYSYNRWVQPVDNSPSICLTYFSMFALGGALGMHYAGFAAWLRRQIGWVMPLAGLLGCSFVLLFVLEQRRNMSFSGYWYEALFFLYAAFAAMSFIWIGRLLLERAKPAAAALNALGAASFGIYFVHPAVLTYFKTEVPNDSGSTLHYFVYVAAAFALSLLVPWALTYVYGQIAGRLRRGRPRPAPQRA